MNAQICSCLSLVCVEPDHDVPGLRLERLPAVIGRGEDVALRVPDRWVSRHHCVLADEEGQLTVRDLGSKHGTYVNERRVDFAQLHPGDLLAVGLCSFRVAADGDA